MDVSSALAEASELVKEASRNRSEAQRWKGNDENMAAWFTETAKQQLTRAQEISLAVLQKLSELQSA
jgi:hypothetical protein